MDTTHIKVVDTFDATPTWTDVLRIYRRIWPDLNEEGRELVWAGFARMAEAADKYNTIAKADGYQ